MGVTMRNHILYTVMSLTLLNIASSCSVYSSDSSCVHRAFDRADEHAQRGDAWGAYEIDKAIIVEMVSEILECDKDSAQEIMKELRPLFDELKNKQRYRTNTGKQRLALLEKFVRIEEELIRDSNS